MYKHKHKHKQGLCFFRWDNLKARDAGASKEDEIFQTDNDLTFKIDESKKEEGLPEHCTDAGATVHWVVIHTCAVYSSLWLPKYTTL